MQFCSRRVDVVGAIIVGKPSARHHLRASKPERFDRFTQVTGCALEGRVDHGQADQAIFVTGHQ